MSRGKTSVCRGSFRVKRSFNASINHKLALCWFLPNTSGYYIVLSAYSCKLTLPFVFRECYTAAIRCFEYVSQQIEGVNNGRRCISPEPDCLRCRPFRRSLRGRRREVLGRLSLRPVCGRRLWRIAYKASQQRWSRRHREVLPGPFAFWIDCCSYLLLSCAMSSSSDGVRWPDPSETQFESYPGRSQAAVRP